MERAKVDMKIDQKLMKTKVAADVIRNSTSKEVRSHLEVLGFGEIRFGDNLYQAQRRHTHTEEKGYSASVEYASKELQGEQDELLGPVLNVRLFTSMKQRRSDACVPMTRASITPGNMRITLYK